MDRTGADFPRCVDMMIDRLGTRPMVITWPIGTEAEFKGIVDVVKMKALIWHDEQLGAKFDEVEIPAEYQEKAKELRAALVEMAVEEDDKLIESYLEGVEPSEADLKRCIRKGTNDFHFVPVMCGSAFKNKGVQPLLDAVVDYLPSPLDIPPLTGIVPHTGKEDARPADDKAPFAGLAFKIMDDPFVGSITFVRVYSGIVQSGTGALNSVKDKTERVGRMLLMHANSREDVKEAFAGDIVAFAGLKYSTTGETLCDPNHPMILEKMEFPDPVIEVAIEPKTKADQEKMGMALVRLAQEDPSFRVSTDQESGQTILKGMGELHLEIKVDILRRTYKVEANVGAPQVAYRETLSRPVSIKYTHKKQTGGSGQFAEVSIDFEPLAPGSGFVFENDVVGGSIPKEFIPAVEKGLKAQKESGLLAGFPVIDFKATLDGRQVPRGGLQRAHLRHRGARGVPRARGQGRREAARADHEGRSRDAGGFPRWRHRRSQLTPRPGAGHRLQRQCTGRDRHGPARQHVRLHQHAALHVPGSCAVFDAVRSLRAGSAGDCGRSQSQVRVTHSLVSIRREYHGEGQI